MAHTTIHGVMGSLKQTAEPGRNTEPEHLVCCSCPEPCCQQPMAMCQGAGFRALFNRTPSDHGTTAAVLWSGGHWLGSPLSFPRVRNGGPSPGRGAESHPAPPRSPLAGPTSLTVPCWLRGGELMPGLTGKHSPKQCAVPLLPGICSQPPVHGRGVRDPWPQAAVSPLWQQPGNYRHS